MRNYTITVNGNVYDVTVDGGEGGAAPVVSNVKAEAPKAAAPAGSQGAVKVNAPMPGKILAVKTGAAVKKGDVLLILEAMKMENEVVAPQDGTVASVNVAEGAMVESGDVLATLN